MEPMLDWQKQKKKIICGKMENHKYGKPEKMKTHSLKLKKV